LQGLQKVRSNVQLSAAGEHVQMNYVVNEQLQLVSDTLFRSLGSGGVYARTARFEQVVDGLTALISRYRDPDTEIFKFPPVINRAQVEKSGYLHSFPHLLGCVSCLQGSESEIRRALETNKADQEWVTALSATDLVLAPAACYPLYPLVASRGQIPRGGVKFDVSCDCFRRESTHEIGRFQSFRMREYVFIGAPEEVVEFRSTWLARADEFANALGIPYRIAAASDPFFGRAGKMMAASQVEQELKFELLIPLRSEEAPTACMSFNYHRDHFGIIWGLRTESDEVAHTACVAFGIDRLALALFSVHGVDFGKWPRHVREGLSV
jgi:seryl-tRNA synthetase